jgi:hypothetical protein
MAHDSEYFRRRAEEARAAAFSKQDGDGAAVAGDLALAYAALAKRRAAAAELETVPIEEVAVATAD